MRGSEEPREGRPGRPDAVRATTFLTSPTHRRAGEALRRSTVATAAVLLILPAVAAGVPAAHGSDPVYLHIIGPSSTTLADPVRAFVHPAVPFRGPLDDLSATGYDGVGAAEVDLTFHQGDSFHARVVHDTPTGFASVTVAFYTEEGFEPDCVGDESSSDLCYGPGASVEGTVETTRALVWLWDASEAVVCFSVHDGDSNC